MNEILKAKYTLTLSGEYGNISGGYLTKTPYGMQPIWRSIEEEVRIVKSFPNILSTLNENKILQLYYSCGNCVAMIGKRGYELPYREQEYLEVEGVSYGDSAILALENLNRQLKNDNPKAKKRVKAYRSYGSDKYQLESVGGK